MRTRLHPWVLCAVAVGLVCGSAARASGQEVVLFPVYDRSTEPYGNAFSRFLTAMLFETLEQDGWQVVLANPGALYSPMRDSWHPGPAWDPVKAAILPVLGKARRQTEKDDHPRIVVEAEVADAASGAVGHRVEWEQEVKRKDLENGFDAGSWSVGREFWTGIPIAVYSPSREISKQPLGKAVIAMANGLGPQLSSALQAMGVPRRASAAPGPACSVEFEVRYLAQNAASRSYTVLVNGLEESARVKDGKLALADVRGSLVFEVGVRDAPFRLPVQPAYFANTVLDCSRPQRTLTLEIGPSGEGRMVWR